MDDPHNCTLWRLNFFIFTFLKNTVVLLVRVLQAIDSPMNVISGNRVEVSVDRVFEAKQWKYVLRRNRHIQISNEKGY